MGYAAEQRPKTSAAASVPAPAGLVNPTAASPQTGPSGARQSVEMKALLIIQHLSQSPSSACHLWCIALMRWSHGPELSYCKATPPTLLDFFSHWFVFRFFFSFLFSLFSFMYLFILLFNLLLTLTFNLCYSAHINKDKWELDRWRTSLLHSLNSMNCTVVVFVWLSCFVFMLFFSFV